MQRGRIFVLVGAAVLLAAAACSSFTAADPTEGGPDGGDGGNGGPGSDSVAPTIDAGLVDGASGWCQTEAGPHAFCDDFDHGAFTINWPVVNMTDGGSAQVTSTTFSSAPSALRIGMLSDQPESEVFVRHPLGGPGAPSVADIVLAFDFYVESLELGGDASTLDARLLVINTLTDPRYAVELALYRARTDPEIPTLDLIEGDNTGAYARHPVNLAGPITLHAWHRMVFQITFGGADSGTAAEIRGTVDEGPFVVGPPDVGNSHLTPGPLATVLVGLGTKTDQDSTIAIHYDNVTIDGK